MLARRLIADRCVYGVDKNPLAVEMAKLSLWLITLEQNRAFTFLDHALKCGDSLVGVDLEQLRNWTLDKGDRPREVPLLAARIRAQIQEVIQLRGKLESFTVNDIRDQQEKARLHSEADARINDLRTAGNLLLASYFNDYRNNEQDIMRGHLLNVVQRGDDMSTAYYELTANVEAVRPFHWELEFPEVFLNGRSGFDAFVGNPPFLGGQRISGLFGSAYREHLIKYVAEDRRGSADICTYFFLRAIQNLGEHGCFGLIATNTIAQGDTREVGLDAIILNCALYRAEIDTPWPGSAAVVVNTVYGYRGAFNGVRQLNALPTDYIDAFLRPHESAGDPCSLQANAKKSFIGSYILGDGFLLTVQQAKSLLEDDPTNYAVVLPFINGMDVNQRPDQSPSRYVINFHDWSLEQAEQYQECIEIVRREVKPQRDTLRMKSRRKKWWLYAARAGSLYKAIQNQGKVLVAPQVSKYFNFVFLPYGWTYSQSLIIFATEQYGFFTFLQSNLHSSWARNYASTMETRQRYTPSDAFGPFPFPLDITSLEAIGETYHETRRAIMLNRWEGLTATYNRFHDPAESAVDIQELRDLHVEMDRQVAAAYGWDDLALEHGYHETAQGLRFTISEAARRELLTRLLKLNHERFAEECRQGLHTTKKGKKACAEFFAKNPQLRDTGSQSPATSATINLRDKIRPFSDADQERLL